MGPSFFAVLWVFPCPDLIMYVISLVWMYHILYQEAPGMLSDRQKKLVDWLKKRKVASMKLMRHQFQLSQMTVVRYLRQYGYLTSYNQNAAFYTLHDVPQFDDGGLWSYRDVGFSKFGTLTETIVTLVQNAAAGMTVAELEDRLKTRVANLLCRLVQEKRLTPRTLTGRRVVYLAAAVVEAEHQFQQRQKMLAAAAHPVELLPPGLDAERVIQILQQMVVASDVNPEPLARQLARRGVAITAGQVRQVIEHYALEKKRRTSR